MSEEKEKQYNLVIHTDGEETLITGQKDDDIQRFVKWMRDTGGDEFHVMKQSSHGVPTHVYLIRSKINLWKIVHL